MQFSWLMRGIGMPFKVGAHLCVNPVERMVKMPVTGKNARHQTASTVPDFLAL